MDGRSRFDALHSTLCAVCCAISCVAVLLPETRGPAMHVLIIVFVAGVCVMGLFDLSHFGLLRSNARDIRRIAEQGRLPAALRRRNRISVLTLVLGFWALLVA